MYILLPFKLKFRILLILPQPHIFWVYKREENINEKWERIVFLKKNWHPPPPKKNQKSEQGNRGYMDIDSHGPYLLSGENTFHLTSVKIPYLLFGESTTHLTSKWRGTFQYFSKKIA